jgi:hypothetical protein
MAGSRKSFKKGVRVSNWQSYKKKSFVDPNYVKDIIHLLEQRQKQSQTIESRVLSELVKDDTEY